ncbi:MAG: thioredoxin, partial [Muribaculaceae bacterium]|nr:thioredoxin [Muribaculaceae bacterium]
MPIAASRVVDNPWINFASKSAFDISRVEFTDSATTLHFISRGFPTTNLHIHSDPVVKANGKTFRLIGASGITPGEDIAFPENGTIELTLSFEAMPEDTQMFDFVSDYGLWLRGIDLSGKPQPAFPEDVPQEVRTYSADGPIPGPSLTIGETTLNFHLRPYLP